MANDRIRLVCKSCHEAISLFSYYPDPGSVCWSPQSDGALAFVRKHLHCQGYGPDLDDDPRFFLETEQMQRVRTEKAEGLWREMGYPADD